MLTQNFEIIRPEEILIPSDRQRREFTTEDLEASISRVGIINPLVIRQDFHLVAGERRLRAALNLKLPIVPVRFAELLLPRELKLLELEENVRRKDLSWQEKARAMADMFTIYSLDNPSATHTSFALQIGYDASVVSNNLKLAEELAKGKASVVNSPSGKKVLNQVRREGERATQNALADVMDSVFTDSLSSAPEPQRVREPDQDILQESFLTWAPTYRGPKFNLLHMDFPYGLDLQDSDQLQSGRVEHQRLRTYEDSEEVYWSLLDCLATNASHLLSSSCHLFFWFSFRKGLHRRTVEFFEKRLPEVVWDETPLVWWKTDNRGIAPDVTRQPRHVYEPCLFGRMGDRKNVKLISNAYGAPKSNGPHPSEKPLPVLKHFLSMVCDGNTRALDPTCGSGSSLRAAEALGAASVLGLEIDPEFASGARTELRRERQLRLLAEGKNT